MKLIAQVKLQATPEQVHSLKRTLETANAAANCVSQRAWETHTFRQYDLHRLLYREVRDRFGLSAQMAVRCIAKVADVYKLDRKRQRVFTPLGGIAYDARILSWRMSDQTVNLWTVAGRLRLPFVCGERQLALLRTMQGEADLVCREGVYFVYQTCNVEEPPPDTSDDFLGVDLGIVNLAVDSDGEVHSGAAVEEKRRTFAHRRRNLQRKGTKASRRKLRQIKSRQSRFQTDTNHCIAKTLVSKAKHTGKGIALEDLKGIRSRVRASRRQRARLGNWGFAQLGGFVDYKARLAGVPVVYVDPRNTSRTCPACGSIDKANRPNQSTFSCRSCGLAGAADHIAAGNIRSRARGAVKHPMVSAPMLASGTSLRL